MHLIRRFRIPALFCALAVLCCELISRPFAEMGISDDGPYVVMAQKLAATGHIVYNGWAAPMLGWQLYLAATFIKLFGFSFTAVRMSTLLVAMAMAFLLQRTLVRANISERNATIGTLALVLSPLYLMLSVTFLSDIPGLFAIVLCLYGCLRALQASTSRATVAWLFFAVATNAICGTSRQITWLGILVMVPSTLWLLRAQRRVFIAGAAATVVGALFILGCIHWLAQQPYAIPEHLLVHISPMTGIAVEMFHVFLDAPFLLLPIMAMFLFQIRKSRPVVIAIMSALLLGYLFRALHHHPAFLLEPTHGGPGNWVGVHGIHEGTALHGEPPILLNTAVRLLLTIASLGGMLGLIASFLQPRKQSPLAATSSPAISWHQLGVLLVPFSTVYTLVLIPVAATTGIYDRYLLALLAVGLLCLVRYYQDRVRPQLPIASLLLVGITAIYGVAVTHTMFALYRARIALVAELRAADVPATSIDGGFEYNFGVELQHAAYINDPRIVVPANAYVPTPPLPAGTCWTFWHEKTPHIHPLYGVSYDPNACYGLAPFAPITYSRWLTSTPGTVYAVRYTPPSKN